VLNSPFHEVLAQDVAAALPDELRARAEAATTVSEMNDWLAAGAMLRWLTDPEWKRRFLHLLDGDSRRATLALAHAVAEPLPPTGAWYRADLTGVVFQIAVAAAFGIARAGIVVFLTFVVLGVPLPLGEISTYLNSIYDLPVLTTPVRHLGVLVPFVCLAGWHVVEFRIVPGLLERARRWPARRRRLPVPVSGRLDTFNVVWCAIALAPWAAVSLRSVAAVFELTHADSSTGQQVTAGLVLLAMGGLGAFVPGTLASLRRGSRQADN
jgi:hypothetical protein